ncbi:MAG: selenium cofactor biosynthesis protein YqeC [Tepidiformaceae bacterium]
MDLYEAFALSPGAIVACVGGGGKTSLVHALAGEAAARGLSALVVSTTKFTRPPGREMPPVLETTDAQAVAAVRSAMRPGSVLALSAGEGTHSRFSGFEPETIDALSELGVGLITVEADGAAHRPFKAPASHEPVIPASATHVIVCVGLGVLGKPLDSTWVHRPELVAALSNAAPGDPVTAENIHAVLVHEAGGRKGVPAGARLSVLLNGPSTPEHEKLGSHIAGRLVYAGFHRGVVATAHIAGDVRAVLS